MLFKEKCLVETLSIRVGPLVPLKQGATYTPFQSSLKTNSVVSPVPTIPLDHPLSDTYDDLWGVMFPVRGVFTL